MLKHKVRDFYTQAHKQETFNVQAHKQESSNAQTLSKRLLTIYLIDKRLFEMIHLIYNQKCRQNTIQEDFKTYEFLEYTKIRNPTLNL